MTLKHVLPVPKGASPCPKPKGKHLARQIVLALCLIALLCAWGCATTPTGRRQLKLIAPKRMQQMGDQAYAEMKKETPEVKDEATREYVRCVCKAVTSALPEGNGTENWDIAVFRKDDMINAFALPGGNIGIYTGLLDVAQTPAQLATVVSHEIAHVRLEHANARMSTSFATQTGISLVGVVLASTGERRQQILPLLGLGAQVGIILPYTRSQETEADVLGLKYMADAGFDPEASITLWRNMKKASGKGPPEFLSTHPSKGTRIDTLKRHLPSARERYRKARASGKNPNCRVPEGD